jgi:hypothetical protein
MLLFRGAKSVRHFNFLHTRKAPAGFCFIRPLFRGEKQKLSFENEMCKIESLLLLLLRERGYHVPRQIRFTFRGVNSRSRVATRLLCSLALNLYLNVLPPSEVLLRSTSTRTTTRCILTSRTALHPRRPLL